MSHIKLHLISLCTVALCAATLVACRRDMQDQPKYEAFEENTFFDDSTAQRPLVEGTVARGYLENDPALYNGTMTVSNTSSMTPSQNNSAVNTQDLNHTGNDAIAFPIAPTAMMLDRGEERFNIYCSPCHGKTGSGDGMIVRRGFRPPPTFHQDRLRNASVGHFFDVITHGFGAMPDYAQQLSPYDRWAVIAYIRALQLSMHVSKIPLLQSGHASTNQSSASATAMPTRDMPTAKPSSQPSVKTSSGGIR